MKTLMCVDGITVTQLNNGAVHISVEDKLIQPIKGESPRDLWKRIEETLYQLSSDAYGWHSEWEYTEIDGMDEEED